MKKGEKGFWKRIVRQSVMFMIMSSILFTVTIIEDIDPDAVTQRFFLLSYISTIIFFINGFVGIKFWEDRKRWQFIIFNVLLFLNTLFRIGSTIYYATHYNLMRLIGSIIPLVIFTASIIMNLSQCSAYIRQGRSGKSKNTDTSSETSKANNLL